MGLQKPAVPDGMEPGEYITLFGTSYRSYGPGSNVDDPLQATGRLEVSLGAVMAMQPGNPALLAPGSYVALVDRSPEVVMGLESVKEEDSLHIIYGRW
jgi:hypothetical protein